MMLAMLTLTVLHPALAAGNAGGHERTAFFHLVAVEKGMGDVMPATLKLYLNGTGEAEIAPCCRIAEDTRYSFKLAVIDAAILVGIDPWTINATAVIHTSAGKLEGPSAGLAFALAALHALQGTEGKGYVATGEITPELLVAPVGGIDAKHGAAMRQGLILIYPAGNIPSNHTMAVPAASLLQAYRIALNSSTQGLRISPGPSPYTKLFLEEAERLVHEASGLKLNETQRKLVEEASKAMEEGYYYAAASLAFRALVEARSQQALGTPLKQLLEEAGRMVSEASSVLEKTGAKGLQDFTMLAEAYYRLYQAEESLSEARRLASTSPSEAARQAVYASLRARTAELWASLATRLSGPPVDQAIAASTAYNYTTIVYRYVDAVASDLNQTQWIKDYRESLGKMYERLEEALGRARYAEAYGLAIGIMDRASSLLVLSMIPGNASKTYMDALWENYAALQAPLAALGLEPASSSLYAEYAWFLRDKPQEALGILVTAVDRLVLERLVELRSLTLGPGEQIAPPSTTSPLEAARPGKPSIAVARLLSLAASIIVFASLAGGLVLLALRESRGDSRGES